MKVIIAGGGAAGFFAAITCKEKHPDAEVIIIESSENVLQKVFLSGGKRCNLSNAQENLRKFSSNYPRGEKELFSLFHHFGPKETIDWFQSRGIPLKTEPDNRVFPQSNHSQTIVDFLLEQARKANVQIIKRCGIAEVNKLQNESGFELTLSDQSRTRCNALVIATGGTPESAGITAARSLGHTIIEQIPSLFTFIVRDKIIEKLPGISIPDVVVSIPETKFKQRGSILITHNGLSGPVILRLSAFAARDLHERGYKFICDVNWVPEHSPDEILSRINSMRKSAAPRKICAQSPFALPSRLWQELSIATGCEEFLVWANLSKKQALKFAELLYRYPFSVTERDTNRNEFVTCGGVKLSEVDFHTMESRICPHLFFAGEVLDIDGVTGGFNLQAAWSTGYVAGESVK